MIPSPRKRRLWHTVAPDLGWMHRNSWRYRIFRMHTLLFLNTFVHFQNFAQGTHYTNMTLSSNRPMSSRRYSGLLHVQTPQSKPQFKHHPSEDHAARRRQTLKTPDFWRNLSRLAQMEDQQSKLSSAA
jgi:hypothetical protein